MNRLELEEKIKVEGTKRKIKVIQCRIYDRGDCLDFYIDIENNYVKDWTYEHQVKELIDDLAPLERPHKVEKVRLSRKYNFFKIGDKIEVENIWIRLDAGEKEPKDLDMDSSCGQYRQGWMVGTIFETPEQNDRALGIKFEKDIYIETKDCGWIGNVTNLEKLIQEEKINKVEAGQPIWSGTNVWEIRKL